MTVRTNQGGSILSFVIIGVVLAGLLIGGAYIVNRQTRVSHDVPSSPTLAPTSSSDGAKKSSPAGGGEKTPPTTSAPQKTTPPPPTTSRSSETELPHTGPAQTVTSIVALGSIGYMVVAYIRSRRARATTLTSLL